MMLVETGVEAEGVAKKDPAGSQGSDAPAPPGEGVNWTADFGNVGNPLASTSRLFYLGSSAIRSKGATRFARKEPRAKASFPVRASPL